MKHLNLALLASAAGVVTVAAASAADLPTRKAAPSAEYVRICSISGKTGFVLPGSDTCLKISGFVRADYGSGDIKNQYKLGLSTAESAASLKETLAKYRPAIGMSVRAVVGFEAVSNTAYGPLYGSVQEQVNYAWGYDPFGATKLLNSYITWAGITAGRHASFFDFYANGAAWKDFISPDNTAAPPAVLAYTASFGSGFGATVAIQDTFRINQFSSFESEYGERAPDIVVSLDDKDAWGRAHLAGVAHYNSFYATGAPGLNDKKFWGWGAIGAVEANIPSFGQGDVVGVQAVYTKGAINYSGLLSPAIASSAEGDNGLNMSGNGTIYAFTDAFYNPATNAWSVPTAWSAAAVMKHAFSPQFSVAPEISYGHISYSDHGLGGAAEMLSGTASSWLGGATVSWDPVKDLDFSLDMLYQHSHFAQPATWVGPGWMDHADGFDGRLRIRRSF